MFRKQYLKALVLAGLLTVVLVFCLSARTAAQMKLALGSFFLPLFGLSRTATQLASQAGDALIPRRELLRLNEELRRTNQLLLAQSVQAAAVMSENDQLRARINWQAHSPWKDRLKLAHVVARDPANWWQTITIDLGTRDGIREDLPVLADDGQNCQLVGRIKSAALTRAQVELIGSPGCKVSAVILGDKARELGVITGRASAVDNTLVKLSYLSNNSSVKPGQTVLSSDAGGLFPYGIPIGRVAEEPHPVDFGQAAEARVKLGANLGSLEEVWVLVR